MTSLNASTITAAQITALATEAAAAGDTAMMRVCNRAIWGKTAASRKRACGVCARAIRAAAAMAD